MFNVYPYEISYTRTDHAGVLRGIPCRCTFGVENEHAGKRIFDQIVRNNPHVHFSDYACKTKKIVR